MLLAVAAAAATFRVIRTKASESGHLKRSFSSPPVASAHASRGRRCGGDLWRHPHESERKRAPEAELQPPASCERSKLRSKNNAPRVPFDTRRVPLFGLKRFPALSPIPFLPRRTCMACVSSKALREISRPGVPERELVSGRFPFRRSLATRSRFRIAVPFYLRPFSGPSTQELANANRP